MSARRAIFFAGALAAAGLPVTAATLSIPNGTFSSPGNQGSLGGGLGNANALIASGPWSASSQAVLSLLLGPRVTVGSGVAQITGLLDVNAAGLGIVNNSASIYNSNIGSKFTTGNTYTLSVDFSSSAPLSVSLLSNSGVGLRLLANGNAVATTAADSATIALFSSNSGRLTLNYTSALATSGQDIGVEMFAGRGNGLGDLSLLSTITFDNVSLTAVPEPATTSALLGLAGFATFWWRRQRRRSRGRPPEKRSPAGAAAGSLDPDPFARVVELPHSGPRIRRRKRKVCRHLFC